MGAYQAKVNLPLCLIDYAIKYDGMKTKSGGVTQFLTSQIDGGEWSAARPGHLIPGFQLYRGLGGPRSQFWRSRVKRNRLTLPGIETPVVQPIAHSNTNWGTPAPAHTRGSRVLLRNTAGHTDTTFPVSRLLSLFRKNKSWLMKSSCCRSVIPLLLSSERLKQSYEVWYVCYSTWALLNCLLRKSLPV
jgi:hypothetical protein